MQGTRDNIYRLITTQAAKNDYFCLELSNIDAAYIEFI
jgi:hypothetical protein